MAKTYHIKAQRFAARWLIIMVSYRMDHGRHRALSLHNRRSGVISGGVSAA